MVAPSTRDWIESSKSAKERASEHRTYDNDNS
jgi:hypothetical protein